MIKQDQQIQTEQSIEERYSALMDLLKRKEIPVVVKKERIPFQGSPLGHIRESSNISNESEMVGECCTFRYFRTNKQRSMMLNNIIKQASKRVKGREMPGPGSYNAENCKPLLKKGFKRGICQPVEKRCALPIITKFTGLDDLLESRALEAAKKVEKNMRRHQHRSSASIKCTQSTELPNLSIHFQSLTPAMDTSNSTQHNISIQSQQKKFIFPSISPM